MLEILEIKLKTMVQWVCVCVRVQYAYQSGFEHSCKMNTSMAVVHWIFTRKFSNAIRIHIKVFGLWNDSSWP